MRVIVLVDWEACHLNEKGVFELYEGREKSFVVRGLQKEDREIVVLPYGPDLHTTIERITDTCPDVIFNLSLSIKKDRRKAYIIAAVLDGLGIPYTGSESLGLQLSQDKALSKQIVRSFGMQVPDFFTLEPDCEVPDKKLNYPLIIKPRYGDSSEFLTVNSVVTNDEMFNKQVKEMFECINAPIICEEFIGGKDVFLSIIGNESLLLLPPREFLCNNVLTEAPQFETWKVKHDNSYIEQWKIEYPPASLSESEKAELFKIGRCIYRCLGLRDYARLDFRLSKTGDFKFLEANPHPDLSPSTFGTVCSWVGIKYSDLLTRILEMALNRTQI